MRKTLAFSFSAIIWFAVITQLILMMQNRTSPVAETIIRFFSFFTILTNTLAAVYFTGQIISIKQTNRPGVLSALTVYIFMVGIVYQVLLRHIWQPQGMQMIIDELLHTINPLLVIFYWYKYEQRSLVFYSSIKTWLIYPVVYLVYVIIRGGLSGFYPYPFINVTQLGLAKSLTNSLLLSICFIVFAMLFIAIGRRLA